MASAFESGTPLEDDGIEAAFDLISEVSEVVRTGIWVGDVFIFTNVANRLNYFVGGEVVTIAHLEKPMYILGFLATTNRVYMCDKVIFNRNYT